MKRLLLTISLAAAVVGCQKSDTSTRAAPDETIQMPESESTTTLNVGSKAPAFSLEANDGATVSLADATANGPAVIVFYRGDW